MIKPISTQLAELIRAIRTLPRSDMVQLVQLLAGELIHDMRLGSRTKDGEDEAATLQLQASIF